jgi:hypothetical protein
VNDLYRQLAREKWQFYQKMGLGEIIIKKDDAHDERADWRPVE